MRVRRASAAIALLSVLLAGCGGSSGGEDTAAADGTSSGSAGSTGEAADGDTADPATAAPEASAPAATETAPAKPANAAAARLAKAGILTAADMPGFAAEPQSAEPEDDALDAKGYACLGAKQPAFVARDYGTAFTKGALEIDSSADVVKSAAIGKADLKAWQGSKAESCVKKVLTEAFSGMGVKIDKFVAKLVPVKLAKADGAYAFQLSVTASGPGGSITLSGFEIGALVGTVELGLTVIETDQSTYTLEQAQALADKAAGRVRAAAKK